ncbi:hypothetical protein [Streptomyces lydicus]|uniref:hypothetical protein n=1 Tax=Streptomyces lydicus TaxID=47763 RepID=UPI0010127396|nr:hypothetical protein [Streptomyces lydicus]MCZ1006352.1 hypothetical protein [Streptomyces lydicus]
MTAPVETDTPLLPWLRQQATDTVTALSKGTRWAVALAARLGEGSRMLAPRLVAHLAAWVRRGQRHDLTGLPAYLGNGVRCLVIAGATYGAWRLADRHHAVLWPAAAGWLLAAYNCHRSKGQWPTLPKEASKSTDKTTPDTSPEAPAEHPVVALVRALIGDDEGVHLGELYPAMRERLDGLSEAPDEQLRQTLTDHRIEVARTVRSRGVAGRTGVRRSALPPLPSPKTSLQKDSSPLSTDGDAGQSASTKSRGEKRRADGDAEESGGEHTVHIVQDKDNPAHWLVKEAG